MAHFAELDKSNVVLRVIVVHNDVLKNEKGEEEEALGIAFCQELLGADTRWVQTSYNRSFRKNYCGVGFTFDEKLDAFLPIKQYNSWVLNKDKYVWEAPIPEPDDDLLYHWDEEAKSWFTRGEKKLKFA
jgi:hypothetical protein